MYSAQQRHRERLPMIFLAVGPLPVIEVARWRVGSVWNGLEEGGTPPDVVVGMDTIWLFDRLQLHVCSPICCLTARTHSRVHPRQLRVVATCRA